MRDSHLKKIVFESYRNSSLIVVLVGLVGLVGRGLVATHMVANANKKLPLCKVSLKLAQIIPREYRRIDHQLKEGERILKWLRSQRQLFFEYPGAFKLRRNPPSFGRALAHLLELEGLVQQRLAS